MLFLSQSQGSSPDVTSKALVPVVSSNSNRWTAGVRGICFLEEMLGGWKDVKTLGKIQWEISCKDENSLFKEKMWFRIRFYVQFPSHLEESSQSVSKHVSSLLNKFRNKTNASRSVWLATLDSYMIVKSAMVANFSSVLCLFIINVIL